MRGLVKGTAHVKAGCTLGWYACLPYNQSNLPTTWAYQYSWYVLFQHTAFVYEYSCINLVSTSLTSTRVTSCTAVSKVYRGTDYRPVIHITTTRGPSQYIPTLKASFLAQGCRRLCGLHSLVETGPGGSSGGGGDGDGGSGIARLCHWGCMW